MLAASERGLARPVDRARPEHRSAHELRWAALAGLGFTAVVALVTVVVVREYYRTHQPHYDSIASYARAYAIVNAGQGGDLGAAWALVSRSSMSWLQALYALAVAWLPARSPEWFVPLNFLLMALTQGAILVWCRDQQYGARQALVLLVSPYLPGIFNVWDGGLQDWRRDAQLNVLLIGDFFLALAYVARPSVAKGLALGLLLGLTQWSRDNALSMIVLVVIPALAIAGRQLGQRRRWSEAVRLAGPPAVVFCAMAGAYYAYTIDLTISRYLYGVWGPGEDRLTSLLHFWRSPIDVLLGGTTQYNGKAPARQATLALLGGGAAVLAAAVIGRVLVVEPRRLLESRSRVLLVSGAFVTAAVVLYTTLGLGYGAQYHGMPLMPTLVGIVGIAAGLTDAFAVSATRRPRWAPTALLVLGLAALFATTMVRTLANRYDEVGPTAVVETRDAARRVAEIAAGRPVALLSLFELGPAQAGYYGAQQGFPEFEVVENAATRRPAPPAEDAALLAELEQRIRTGAAVVVVCSDTRLYADPTSLFPLFRSGRALADRLLADPDFEAVDRLSVGGRPFTVLVNRTLP